MAGRLMGSAPEVRGFDSFWINEALLKRKRFRLPDLGRHQNVSGANEWARLIAAHDASVAADPQQKRS